jgi:hypothetical protein
VAFVIMRALVSKSSSSLGVQILPDDEGALVDPPQPFALSQFGELADLGGGESQDFTARHGFVGGLVVEDAGGGVAE